MENPEFPSSKNPYSILVSLTPKAEPHLSVMGAWKPFKSPHTHGQSHGPSATGSPSALLPT
jgi:hypothetical protein